MKTFFPALGLFFCLTSLAAADPALTSAASPMRAAPTGKARIVQNVPARAEIDLSNCSKYWCYASWRNVFGYLPVSVMSGRPPGGPPIGPPPPPVVVAPWGWGPFYGYGWYSHW
jgi:hypothetical protein